MTLFALLFAESQGCERRRDGRKQTGDSTGWFKLPNAEITYLTSVHVT